MLPPRPTTYRMFIDMTPIFAEIILFIVVFRFRGIFATATNAFAQWIVSSELNENKNIQHDSILAVKTIEGSNPTSTTNMTTERLQEGR